MGVEYSALALVMAAHLATRKGTPGAVARCRSRQLRAAEHIRGAGLSVQARTRPREAGVVAIDLMARACRICGKCPGVIEAPGKSA